MKRLIKISVILLCIILISLAGNTIFQLFERLEWRLVELQTRVKYTFSPPEEAVFVPKEQDRLPTTQFSLPTNTLSSTPDTSPSPSPSPTPLPVRVSLTGVRHEYQTWNNCGPANLSMALSVWDWQGTQQQIADYTKPNPRDKNVMPYELAVFVREQTDFKVIVRVGGDLDLVKTFLSAGIPVILEKGFEGAGFDFWLGHYVTVTGYDDTREEFVVQDSYIMPDMPVSYEQVESFWRAFNFTYLVIFPVPREEEVLAILGAQIDEKINYQSSLTLASEEIYRLSGREEFFAWFNRGSNLVALQDYAAAAAAYDKAFDIYAELPDKQRPWRMMWYQTGPYWAYFYSGRYYDVINLATTTLNAMSEPILEESYYWRALAREALGDISGATEDLETSLKVHPGFEPSIFQLERLSN